MAKKQPRTPGTSKDHLTPRVRGGGITMDIPIRFHEDRHTIFVHLTFAEMPGQLALMEDKDGRLNPRFMVGDFKGACERRFGVAANGDDAWKTLLDMYGVDVVRKEMDRQFAGRSLTDIILSQLRKFAMVYGEKAAQEAVRALCEAIDKSKTDQS